MRQRSWSLHRCLTFFEQIQKTFTHLNFHTLFEALHIFLFIEVLSLDISQSGIVIHGPESLSLFLVRTFGVAPYHFHVAHHGITHSSL